MRQQAKQIICALKFTFFAIEIMVCEFYKNLTAARFFVDITKKWLALFGETKFVNICNSQQKNIIENFSAWQYYQKLQVAVINKACLEFYFIEPCFLLDKLQGGKFFL